MFPSIEIPQGCHTQSAKPKKCPRRKFPLLAWLQSQPWTASSGPSSCYPGLTREAMHGPVLASSIRIDSAFVCGAFDHISTSSSSCSGYPEATGAPDQWWRIN